MRPDDGPYEQCVWCGAMTLCDDWDTDDPICADCQREIDEQGEDDEED